MDRRQFHFAFAGLGMQVVVAPATVVCRPVASLADHLLPALRRFAKLPSPQCVRAAMPLLPPSDPIPLLIGLLADDDPEMRLFAIDLLEEAVPDGRSIPALIHSNRPVRVTGRHCGVQSSPAHHVGRVVLIAPPNGGVPLATTFSPLFRPFCSAVCELSHEPHSFVNRLTDPHSLEIGVIAGRFDFLVPPRRTQLAGQKDHICLPGTHNSLLLQKRAANQVISFLRTGRFEARSGGSSGALQRRSA